MGELRGTEDLRFAWSAAEQLGRDLRATASVCEAQIPHREAIAGGAREEWRGVFAEKFDERMKICTGDADRLAGSLRDAAAKLDQLVRLAREEQARRDEAQAWKVRHDAWEREQEDRNIGEKFVDIFDDDEPKPPDLTPRSEPVRMAEPHMPVARE